jgi:large repetitive protein
LTSVAGTYTITYSIIANSTNCFTTDLTSTSQITINPIIIPVTGFTYPTPVCKNSLTIMSPTLTSGFTAGGVFSSTVGLDINATTGLIDLSNSTAGTYVVNYNTAANSTTCQLAGLSSFTIVINPIITPVVGFSYNTPICKNALVNPNPILASGFVTGGVFSSTANLDVDPVTGIINLANSNVGTYVVTYTLTANPALCRLAGSSTTTITINTVINPIPNFSYVTPVCKNVGTANIVQGTGFTFGGVFSSTSGLSINSATGIIDLAASTSGNYTVNYVITANATNCFSANSSSSATITIAPSANSVTGFNYTNPVCKNAINPSPNLVTGFTLGGTFSSTPGLSINASTGIIDLTLSTPATYTITYTYLNNIIDCITAGSNTATITINPTINAVTGFSYNTPFCKNDANPSPTFVAGFSTGGAFTSTAGLSISATTGIINLQASTAGTYVINYNVLQNTSTCLLAGNSNATITINPMVNAVTNFSYTSPVCKLGLNPVPNTSASGFTTGGTFSSTTGLSINSTTGIINLAASTAGTYLVSYNTIPNLATCLLAGNGTATIVITPDITAVTNFTYATPICKNATAQTPILPTGFTTGGTFSSTAGLSISATTGIINVASSTAGTYTITYNSPINLASCTSTGNSTFQVTITPIAAAVTTISYPATICRNDVNPTPNTSATGFTTGGTYTSTTGLSINATSGIINLATSTSGIYTITYSVTPNTTACVAGGSSTATITITEPLVPTFTAINTSICLNGSVQSLPTVFVSGIAVAGTWTPALVTSNAVGTTDYTFNYTNAICANKPKITVNVFAPTLVPTFPSIILSVCYNSTAQVLPTRSFEGIDGTWLPATISNTETRTYEFTPNFGLCALKKSITITVIPEVLSELKSECSNANYLLNVLPINNSFNLATSTFEWTKVGSSSIIANTPTLNVTNILNGNTPIYPLIYSVKITTNGCSSISTFSIDNIYCEIQKGISPNGDKKNDYFDLTNFEVKQLEIFNRYGTKVYAKSGYKNEWEGQTDGGTSLPDGTYFYNIEFNDNDIKTGWIYINKETN